ncbi:MAG TPA: FKBP-type peptidyl-prolyl cis-trans isomerase [Pyrinomonadaceae bacterium]|nr:FKBP-type peptidyl-prolyl cis-trans isomerase [Pyrinomonadaceae bacterium]
MPQSRHRKTGKAKKRPRGLYPAAKTAAPSERNKQARLIAILVVIALAAAAVTYLIANRNSSSSGTEVVTASGLKYTDVAEGTGTTTQNGQMLTVHYTGTLQNGTKFDSSVDRGKPYQFRLGSGSVIKGWDEGLLGMKVGGKRKLVIPAALGYGARGTPNIPPNSTLLFDIELIDAK